MSESPSTPSNQVLTALPEPPDEQIGSSTLTIDEVLDDLSIRFILNLPDEELASVERLCFQVEQAHWYYEDFIRDGNPHLPSLPLKRFSAMLFAHCPLLQKWSPEHEEAFNSFMQYKTMVPVCGAIMLNESMDKCVLVKGWKASSGWGFPKGKINETEPPHMCAIREVLEETGYNLAGQVNPDNVVRMEIRGQQVSLFIVPGVPEDFPFKTKTRKEISKIEWFRLVDLPAWKRNKSPAGKFYLITPFIGPLKTFINSQKKNGRKGAKSKKGDNQQPTHKKSTNFDPRPPQPANTSARDIDGPGVEKPDKPKAKEETVATMDPVLARLLTGLTLSQQQKTGGASTTQTQEIQPHILPSKPEPAPIVEDSGKVSNRPPSVTPVHAPREHHPPLPEANQRTVVHPRSSPATAAPNSLSIQPNKANQPTSPSLVTPAKLSPTSPRSQQSSSNVRRSSATADISPYLFRPSEPPVSAKTLQHLSLLESVALESERMAPILAARTAQLTAARPPGPPALHHNLPPDPRPFTALDPSAFPPGASYGVGNHPPYPNAAPPLLQSLYDQSYQARSHTSQAYHRPPMHNATGSINLNNFPMPIPAGRVGVDSFPFNPGYGPLTQPPYAGQLPGVGPTPGVGFGQLPQAPGPLPPRGPPSAMNHFTIAPSANPHIPVSNAHILPGQPLPTQQLPLVSRTPAPNLMNSATIRLSPRPPDTANRVALLSILNGTAPTPAPGAFASSFVPVGSATNGTAAR